MSKDININVHHLTRVEGHGNIVVNIKDGTVEKCEWQVPEAPRFFEAMVRGRRYDDIQTIVSRICGICSISHSLVATKAVEDAMDLEVSEQADLVRHLMHYSEQLQSHVLHVGYLVAPDLFGEKSVVPLATKATEAVLKIIKCHRVANQMSKLIAGRITHPITLTPGGMTKMPTEQELKDREKFEDELFNRVREIEGMTEPRSSCSVLFTNLDKGQAASLEAFKSLDKQIKDRTWAIVVILFGAFLSVMGSLTVGLIVYFVKAGSS